MKFVRNFIRFFVLSIIRPVKMADEMKQYEFWFEETQKAFQSAKKAETQEELEKYREQFGLARKRYEQHRKYICP